MINYDVGYEVFFFWGILNCVIKECKGDVKFIKNLLIGKLVSEINYIY